MFEKLTQQLPFAEKIRHFKDKQEIKRNLPFILPTLLMSALILGIKLDFLPTDEPTKTGKEKKKKKYKEYIPSNIFSDLQLPDNDDPEKESWIHRKQARLNKIEEKINRKRRYRDGRAGSKRLLQSQLST